ncbi:PAS domain S-box protein [Mucilaginibacter pedocola]|uniref:PAS domain-containing protein n=1 Tax=Mucilaginibacter pedocola TaxID=1792845 RepID=A0A1S9P7M5_9SPHI|nr:PAS domain S-box protein [Mucilaginibacter pedocola]OOQ56952.1 hypothetical protein BC343_15525 [Mucilaginibacter pedocola]
MTFSFRNQFRNYYTAFVGKRILQDTVSGQRDLSYWQNRLFTTAIFFALPVSLFALIPSVILELQEGHTYIVAVNFFALGSVAFFATTTKISIHLRKMFIAGVIVCFAIVAMAFMGSFTMGCIYLFPLSIYVALQFSSRLAYGTVALNFAICSFFALVIWLRPFNLPELFKNVSLNHWLIYSVNFVFMDLVVVILIRQLLTGLERTMVKENSLYRNLQKEWHEKQVSSELLKESEAHYRTLFFQSPLPKWILDSESLAFLQVNNAALNAYGYTEEEFLQMKLQDIHLQGQLPEF